MARERKRPGFVIGVVGRASVGKTSLLELLIPALEAGGPRSARRSTHRTGSWPIGLERTRTDRTSPAPAPWRCSPVSRASRSCVAGNRPPSTPRSRRCPPTSTGCWSKASRGSRFRAWSSPAPGANIELRRAAGLPCAPCGGHSTQDGVAETRNATDPCRRVTAWDGTAAGRARPRPRDTAGRASSLGASRPRP